MCKLWSGFRRISPLREERNSPRLPASLNPDDIGRPEVRDAILHFSKAIEPEFRRYATDRR